MIRFVKYRLWCVGALLFLMSTHSAQADSLLYALTDKNGTSIFRYSPNGEPQQVFSDHNSPVSLYELASHRRIVAAKGRIFAYGKPKKPSKADYALPDELSYRRERYHTYIYELSPDGRDSARKITKVFGTQSPRTFFVSPNAGYIAYLNVEWWRDEQDKSRETTYIYIHDTTSGELISKIDSGLRAYGSISGITWLDENHIYLWRMPVIDVHLAEDQDISKPVGPFIVDIRNSKFTALDRNTMLTMVEQDQRSHEEFAPLCTTALNKSTLLCQTYSSGSQHDEKCVSAYKRNVFLYDIENNLPKRIYQSDFNCKENWLLSPSGNYLVSLSYFYRLKEMQIWLQNLEQNAEKEITKTASPTEWLYIIGWETN